MPDQRERLGGEAWRWLQMAQENLVAAEHDLGNPAIARRIPSFWAQQTAELAMKAVLVAEDTDPPKHHDLIDLRSACDAIEMRGLGTSTLEENSTCGSSARATRGICPTPSQTPSVRPTVRP
jgi:hypothetical protein